jgi:hypothetical protein
MEKCIYIYIPEEKCFVHPSIPICMFEYESILTIIYIFEMSMITTIYDQSPTAHYGNDERHVLKRNI